MRYRLLLLSLLVSLSPCLPLFSASGETKTVAELDQITAPGNTAIVPLWDPLQSGASKTRGVLFSDLRTTLLNGLTLTTSTGTLTIANSKTLTVGNTLTLAGTDGSTLNIGTGGTLGTAAFTASTAYLAPNGDGSGLTALSPTALTGSTTAGRAFLTLTNPGAISFPRLNADNSVTALSAAAFRTAIGAGTSSFDGVYASLTSKPDLAVYAPLASPTFTGTVNAAAVILAGNLTFGTDKAYTIGADGANRPGAIYCGGVGLFDAFVRADSFRVNSGTRIRDVGDGSFLLQNSNETTFGAIFLGGLTSSFPALKRNGAALEFRLADDSAFAATQSLYDRFGSGTPEGAVTAPIGATYHRTDGGAGTSLYVKESGTGNTGWVAK